MRRVMPSNITLTVMAWSRPALCVVEAIFAMFPGRLLKEKDVRIPVYSRRTRSAKDEDDEEKGRMTTADGGALHMVAGGGDEDVNAVIGGRDKQSAVTRGSSPVVKSATGALRNKLCWAIIERVA